MDISAVTAVRLLSIRVEHLAYGYYRYKYLVMFAAVILLILLVQLFQTVGTKLAVKCDKRLKK